MNKKINFAELAKKLHVKILSPKSVINDKWFIGSALQSVDFKNFKRGIYFYEQPTIWTRMLDVEIINPYWEIKNDTTNFLIVNESEYQQISLLKEILKFYLDKTNEKKDTLYFFGEPWSLLEEEYSIEVNNLKLPFFIEKKEVGSYLKIYQKRGEVFYPLIDCTRFEINSNKYFEININSSYMDMAINKLKTIFESEKYASIFSAIKLENTITDQRAIRLYSLTYTLQYLSNLDLPVDSSYMGHSIKKMLKMLALQIKLLKVNSAVFDKLMSKTYFDLLKSEIQRLDHFDKSLLTQIDSHTLMDRYGISRDFQLALTNKLVVYRNYDSVIYYTDIPFCPQINSDEQFIFTMKSIQRKKETK